MRKVMMNMIKEVENKISNNTNIKIRRQWNNWKIAEVEFSKISNLHWDNTSGGVAALAPQYFIHGYIWCDTYAGELSHSCMHGEGPHRIKVCITKTDNLKIFDTLKSIVGDKPVHIARKKRKAKRKKSVAKG
jgi:hypothetical protein